MTSHIANPVIHVAVGVIQRADGRVLLTERPAGKVSAGYWEFPGGKFDAGERVEEALVREVREEVGITAELALPWMVYDHDYPDKRVRLHFFRVLAWRGTPTACESQRLSWEDPAAVTVAPLLPANGRALTALRLPTVYATLTATRHGIPEFMAGLERALARGVRLFRLRAHDLTPAQFTQFARRVIRRAHDFGALLLIEGGETVARQLGTDGLHTPDDQLRRMTARPVTRLWSVTCHDENDLARARYLGADLVVLTAGNAPRNGAAAPAWERLSALARGYSLPVYAAGDDHPSRPAEAAAHGLRGVAITGQAG
jgi:8-oxo-dGTP diphosphatase